MAKFPTYEQMAKEVAEKALDEYLINGKSLREWIRIIAEQDCISRQAVLNLAITIETDDYSGNEILEVVEVDDIKKLPSVNPQEPKTGHWIFGIDEDTGEKDLYAWTCSECGGKYPWQPNYCPNCGAKMSEVSK